jgi:hypothetical protein
MYQIIFDFLDFDFALLTPNFVKLQLLNKQMYQKIHQAVQLYYKNVKEDIKLFCTKNKISIPHELFSTIFSSNDHLEEKFSDDAGSCKRKRTTYTKNKQTLKVGKNQSIDGLNFVKKFIDHVNKVFMNALQQKNDFLDAFKFYHKLFTIKNTLPVHINRLFIFAIATSFQSKQRHQIFNDNKIVKYYSNSWDDDKFIYNFRTDELSVTSNCYFTSLKVNIKNIQLPLFFICSSTNTTQIFCLQKVQALVKMNKEVSLKFHKPDTNYYIVCRPSHKFIGYTNDENFNIKSCFDLKDFV